MKAKRKLEMETIYIGNNNVFDILSSWTGNVSRGSVNMNVGVAQERW